MRDYEVVYIFDSELGDEEVESKLDSYHERISGAGSGEVTAVEDWGKRQLAYPIEDQENGRYVVAQFTVEPSALDEFERSLELDGDLLRHLVVLHEGELPTPPSARRPGAAEEDEDEGEEEEPESAEDEAEDEGEEESDEPDEDGDDEASGDEAAGEDEEDDDEEDEEQEQDQDEEEDEEEDDEEDEGGKDEDEDGDRAGEGEDEEETEDDESGEDEEKE